MTPDWSRYASQTSRRGAAEAASPVEIPSALPDELVKGSMTAAEVQAASLAFKKALIERAMGAELSHHLGYREGEAPPVPQTNHRNGHSEKTVLTDVGPVRILGGHPKPATRGHLKTGHHDA